MFVLTFHFPVGRYHATAWGRHVNEADVAWPPEPYRILRALIATYWLKGDKEAYSEEDLSGLIDKLAEEFPSFKLPTASHAHSRHYMPLWKPGKTSLIFDAFARFDPEDPIIVLWPSLILEGKELSLAQHLAGRIGYLGRAESWVVATATNKENVKYELNTYPGPGPAGSPAASNKYPLEQIRILAPLNPLDYAKFRESFLESKKNGKKQQAQVEKTLPKKLLHALSIETSDLQKAGWSAPPASQRVLYLRPEIGPLPLASHRRNRDNSALPTVARYLLAGRPQPQIEEALKIGETMRLAIMSRYGYSEGKSGYKAPPKFSGRDENGKPWRGGKHLHAFYLPEATEGKIDHILVYCSEGFDAEARYKMDEVTKLYIEKHRGKDKENSGRKEWRLALEGFGVEGDFKDCKLLVRSRCWRSLTPYLSPWHLKKNFTYKEAILKECRLRGLPEPQVEELRDKGACKKNSLHFHRFSSRASRAAQPDRIGCFLQLTYPEPVSGPLAFGFGCHYGLGLFQAIT